MQWGYQIDGNSLQLPFCIAFNSSNYVILPCLQWSSASGVNPSHWRIKTRQVSYATLYGGGSGISWFFVVLGFLVIL